MTILDILSTTKKEFNAKTDTIQTSSKLQAGTYPVLLKKTDAGISKFGQAQISLTFEVISGNAKGRTETTYLSFDDGLPPFVLEKNGRILLKIAALTGVEFKESDLADEFTTSEALKNGIGKQFEMKLWETANKKNPAYPYRNYEFSPLSSFGATPQSEIEDDDLPF